MKELSIEEKARRYDKALKVLHKYDGANIMFSQSLKEEMFPELAESEDEKTRRALLQFLNAHIGCSIAPAFCTQDIIKWIAWLEKQAEQNPVVDTKVIIPKFRVGDIVKSKSQPMLRPRKIISICKDCYRCEDRGCIGFAWEDDYEIVEQKPADNAEPKFNVNVGDWLIHNERKHIVKVIHATPLIYEVVNKFGDYHTITNNAIENNYHLWTIQDAKDGDVLATDDGNIFVFDGTVEEDKYPFAYYGLTRRRFESYDRRLPFTHNNVHPATKEQREQLEKAMADAGYTFDFEKKELKKIEKN